ncbi:MAG: hypothetical protein AW09_000485 [Candidatus Accumulibacter phosphatis]|uniref:Uncharacterized protein n=1 Tax=Candidatus Accumulibacter phosphatis TaxID=327160 RepID=A0A080LZ42_9PROT|nr:MAG: hypothetical protein AW09_000485 [Candidatus Accumulibacter phosphatis]
MQVVAGKGAFIHLCQSHLADSRRRLQFMHGARASVPAQTLQAAGNRSGRDENDLPAGLA